VNLGSAVHAGTTTARNIRQRLRILPAVKMSLDVFFAVELFGEAEATR
jgi:hypothetical protein